MLIISGRISSKTNSDENAIAVKISKPINVGNLMQEKTVCKDTFMNIFNFQVILIFWKIPLLLLFITPILGHPLSVNITGFIPLRQKHLWNLMLMVVTEPLFCTVIVQLFLFLYLGGLFQRQSRIIRIIVTLISFNHQRQYLYVFRF